MTVTKWEQPALGSEVAHRDVVDGWAVQVAHVAKLASYIANTDFVPKGYRGQDAAVAAAILAGREIGIGPMTALQHLFVVDGRPAMSAQLMRALVFAHGHRIRVVESTSARCVLTGRRNGDTEESQPVTWSAEDARRAQVAGKPNWSRYPRQMLLARATGELCRRDFPDVIGGLAYTVEEVEDMPTEVEAAPKATRRVRRTSTPPPPGSAPSLPAPAVAPDSPRPDTSDVDPGGEAPPLPDDTPTPRPTRGQGVKNGPQTPADTPPVPDATPAGQGPQDGHKPATAKQLAHLYALLSDLQRMEPRGLRISTVSGLVGHRITTMSALTRAEASPLIDVLIRANENPATLDPLVREGWDRIRLTDPDPAAVEDEAPPPLWEDPAS